MLPSLFCPKCGELILAEPECAACGWLRPAAAERGGDSRWCADAGTRLIKPACYPVVAAGLFCLGTEKGTLLALDLASAKVEWEQSLGPNCNTHALATDGERLFVGCEDVRPIPAAGRAFLALEARTGRPVWSYPTSAHSLSGAAVYEGVVYFTASDGWLHAVDAASGRRRWAVEHGAWTPAAPAAGEGVVCAGGRSESLVAYACDSGRERWRISCARWCATRPSIAAGIVAVACPDGPLYAVEIASGQVRWIAPGERERGFLSPPAIADGRVLAGGRVYREAAGERQPAYALLAFDLRDGRELWRSPVDKRIQPAPAVARGLVFFGAEDNALHAVGCENGREAWRVETRSRVVTEPQVAGDCVYFAGRDGLVHAVRWQAEPWLERLSAQVYADQGRWSEAAAAWALDGELERAAQVCADRLDLAREAALLLERAGQPGAAGALWERVGNLPRARERYAQAGDAAGQARILEGLGQPLDAARLLEQAAQWPEAARLFERAGDRPKAAEMYVLGGRSDLAERIWQDLGQWERRVEFHLEKNHLAEAARILEEHGVLERAADLYEAAGERRAALRIRRQLGHWEPVLRLAAELADLELEVEALQALGQRQAAAETCERAGQQAAAARPADEESAAAWYDRAAALYADLLEREGAARCTREAQRLQRRPQITIRGKSENALVEHAWQQVELQVYNAGFGPARHIAIQFGGPFEVGGNRIIPGLRAQETELLRLFLRSHKDQYGPGVPLDIAVDYQDSRARAYHLTECIPVHVAQQGILPGLAQALSISIGELYQPGAKKVEGHEVQSGGQVGDKVVVGRGSGAGVQVHAAPVGDQVMVARRPDPARATDACPEGRQVRVQRDGPPVKRCATCNLPIDEPGARFCPDCGAELSRGDVLVEEGP